MDSPAAEPEFTEDELLMISLALPGELPPPEQLEVEVHAFLDQLAATPEH